MNTPPRRSSNWWHLLGEILVVQTNIEEMNGFNDVVVLVSAAGEGAKDMACQ